MFIKWGLILIILSIFFFFVGLLYLVKLNVIMIEYYLLSFDCFELKFYLLFDWMSVMFVSVVLFISGMVIIYSNDYMMSEKFKIYFLYGVLMFVGSMIAMILSPNLFMILLGWDGLGVVSYCLVIYYQNYKSDAAGMITILSNRIGDVMILLSIVMLLNFGSLDFFVYSGMYWLSGFMLIVAGMTKSAQIPFSAWLPAAMAAPTPVSSLVHSSTLVTAGIYLLIRLELLMKMEEFSKFLLFFSLMTMMMAGIGAMFETDLKKIIALSTLSQLGLMMMILSLGKIDLTFFHLLTHAMFKAMMFLCAGFMIHSSLGSQDIRFMGGFYKMSPLIGIAFSLANMSLFGIPFLSGFYSKDLILEYVYMNENGLMMVISVIISTISTSIYSLRVMYYSLWKGGVKMLDYNYHWSYSMEFPIMIMGVVVVFFGANMSWILMMNYEFIVLSFDIKLINLFIIIWGVWMFYIFFEKLSIMNLGLFSLFMSKMWFLSSISGSIFSKKIIGGINFYNYDNSWVEEIGPQGIYKLNSDMSVIVNWVQFNGFSNILYFVLFLMIFLI
uniref:NADH-ubiquinone oxidoreductase chain 5 n=1 Tax=Carios mexicanus TaxID=34600 RepID=W0FIE1_CARMN|nr:NADH dehydrogenase subunit 5 [Antricola mexicanus]AHF21659.1 NADH dehydrogenase subunit 5 [Antricola mexicanus]